MPPHSSQPFFWKRFQSARQALRARSHDRRSILTIRKRTILGVTLTLAGLLGAIHTLSTLVVEHSIRDAEERYAKQAGEGVLRLLDQTQADFEARFIDWSSWNDTYDFMVDRNPNYVRSNLDPTSLSKMNVNLVMYFDLKGQSVYQTQVDVSKQALMPVPKSILEQFSPDSSLLRSRGRDNSLTGFLMLPEGAMLVTSQPILNTRSQGDLRGTLVFGRYLDVRRLQKLVSWGKLKIYPAKTAKLPSDLKQRLGLNEQAIAVHPTDPKTISAYVCLNDLMGDPALIVQVDLPRNIAQQGQMNLRSLQLALIATGLLFWLITLFLLEKQATLYQKIQQFNAVLEQEVEERTTQLSQTLSFEALLKRITEKVRDSLDENQILEIVVQELAQELSVVCCDTAIYNLEERTSTIVSEFVGFLPPAKGAVAPMSTVPDLYRVLLRGDYFHGCLLVPNQLRPLSRDNPILACPIADDRGVLGDLWLYNQPHQVFTAAEIGLAQQVSNQCAIAIRQARLFQAAQTQVAELERINRLKDDFLSTVSHELRTPMSSIKMGIQMLDIALKSVKVEAKDELPITENPRVSRYFKILQDECDREIGLINDLLDLSRLEAGGETLVFSTIEPATWLPQLVEPFFERTQNQQQQFRVQVPETLPSLTTDLSKLERILTELLQNACKYTPAGESIVISAQAKSDSTLAFTVANSGVDLPSEELDRMFDKFYRIPNNDPWKHGGTGLGLTLAQRLVNYLGGTIRVDNIFDEIRFTVELPIVPVNQMQSSVI